MPVYVVETTLGMGIRIAPSRKKAIGDALREVGTLHFKHVRLAKRADILYVRMMGGRILYGAEAMVRGA